MLDYQVLQGEKELFELVEVFDDVEARLDQSDQKLAATEADIDQETARLEELKDSSIADTESLRELTADIESREREVQRLQALEAASDGQQARSFEGEGDRQYLTGLRVGGKNILIAIDTSTSMLDDSIVNILRRRNMSQERQRQAPKWQRAVPHSRMVSLPTPLRRGIPALRFR